MTLRSLALPWIATAAFLACALDASAAIAATPSNAPGAAGMSEQAAVAGGRYGNVSVTKPAGPMLGFAVLFSAGDHWTPADQANADALAQRGAMVVGVDTARYAANLAAVKTETCHKLYSDAEAISHQLERQQESSRYFAPIAIGSGQGGLVAARLLAQAPANTVAGAVSLDPATTLDPRFAPCPADPTLSRGAGLPGFFEQGVTRVGAQAATSASAPRGFAPNLPIADKLVALTAPHLRELTETDGDVSDLPLVELPAAHPTDMLAVVISGDGGWRDLDKTIAEALQKDGISVVGWDALRYFWSEKTPAQTSHDLARVLQAYSARWHAKHIALVGYSFGADVMPFVYNRLPEALRAKVSYMSLLGFAPDADFQVRVTGWLGMPASENALPVKPELAKVPPSIVQCVYGENETDTLCPSLANSGIDVVRTTGSHHFDGDYSALAARIIAGWKKEIAARS
ncbi:AcvB/VirJ family lysyl-phosphatidylglycerol hydrolase [Paraburkholderia caballeronis]|uniref:AcvB/VirJ family lysyl-phosphatidylglycerol hydrolase n=1 Tax=Paraburkholderia caballeronis TaxID=416943 RepID=UPI001065A4AC|nr:AcvB/VirJ family lysyl-phosphatidylglycerol hydrolase [Paraburkholderia caballeronis]TDV15096.1 type IV secretory pathway VirJ component [Paraburkholderia caballeronis]TDV16779.1 type IV secretory pathway VirJ component [Paraburkholderia caballeronis]TDV25832.1 type IV secretory pathway VirJ component [Paraburkholderia caballeronis]